MTLAPAIDVVLGLTLVFLLVGLIATAAQEMVAGLFGWRAEMLSRKIEQIIGDPALRWEIEEHPVIAALRGSDGRPPSYIPADCFAAAVLATATAGRLEETPRQVFDSICGWARDDGSPLAQIVLALAQDAEGDPARLRAALAQWYGDAMNRLAGAYKRRAALWGLGFALLIAAALNLDALRLVSALPLGWGEGSVGLNDLPLAILGWLITALGASLFASLWFDLLARLVNLRHAGPRPVWPRRPSVGAVTLAKLPDLSRAREAGSD